MLSILRRYRELLIVLALMALPLLLFLAGTREPGERSSIDRAVLTVFAPVQKGVTWVVTRGQDAWFGYLYLVRVHEQNLDLRRENNRLTGEVSRVEEVFRENERLRELLDFEESSSAEAVVARVIAVGARPALARSVRVGRGSADGVEVGNAVVTPDGVVGRVVAAGPGWADVMLIVDPNSAVPVLGARSRARATVRGTGDLALATLDHAARTDDLEEGDLLVTSGFGGIYPKGLPVGAIASVSRRPHGMFVHGEVVPVVDLARFEEVLILTSAVDEGDGVVAGGSSE